MWLSYYRLGQHRSMKVILVSFLLFGVAWASFLSCECGKRNAGRIVGGKETKKNEYPWMVAIHRTSDSFVYCGGTIVTLAHVLTAAHCARNREPNTLVLLVGAHDVNDVSDNTRQSLSVEKVVYHDDPSSDLALLVTKGDIIFNDNVAPACMPHRLIPGDELADQMVKAMGWGRYDPSMQNRDAIKTLKEVDLQILPPKDCYKFTTTKFCTFTKGKDTCRGDSGGPLVLLDTEVNRYTLVGIVSSGPTNCGNTTEPGVNINVSGYLDWINEQLRMTVSYFRYAKSCYKVVS